MDDNQRVRAGAAGLLSRGELKHENAGAYKAEGSTQLPDYDIALLRTVLLPRWLQVKVEVEVDEGMNVLGYLAVLQSGIGPDMTVKLGPQLPADTQALIAALRAGGAMSDYKVLIRSASPLSEPGPHFGVLPDGPAFGPGGGMADLVVAASANEQSLHAAARLLSGACQRGLELRSRYRL